VLLFRLAMQGSYKCREKWKSLGNWLVRKAEIRQKIVENEIIHKLNCKAGLISHSIQKLCSA